MKKGRKREEKGKREGQGRILDKVDICHSYYIAGGPLHVCTVRPTKLIIYSHLQSQILINHWSFWGLLSLETTTKLQVTGPPYFLLMALSIRETC